MRIRYAGAGAVLLAVAAVGVTGSSASAASSNATPPQVSYQDCGNGVKAVNFKPAPGFDPLTATATELAANGFPLKPTDPTQLNEWITYVTQNFDPNTTCSDLVSAPSPNHQQTPTQQSATTYTSENWSGIVDTTNEEFLAGSGQWVVPIVTATSGTYSSQWVGLGGYKQNDNLYQAGTELDGNGSQHVFWEYVPGNSEQLKDAVATHDTVGASVTIGSPTSDQVTYTLSDGNKFTHSYTSPRSSTPGTGEFIDERTEVNCQFPKYAHQTTTFNDASVDSDQHGWQYIVTPQHVYLNMVDAESDTLATPGTTDQTGDFADDWVGYGQVDSAC